MLPLKMFRRIGCTIAAIFMTACCMNVVAVNNPISYDTEITDCDVIKYNGEYYITGNWLAGDMLRSRDLESWGERRHIFSWSNSWHTATFSPPDKDIHAGHIRYINGTFHYYTQLSNQQLITHATSSNILDSYIEADYNNPFAENIDAETFLDDDGQLYFHCTRFSGGNQNYVRTMSDPWTLTGNYIYQISGTSGWENNTNINEGPKVIKYRNRYYMLYNAYGTGDPNYSIGCVEASSPTGFSNAGKYSAPICTRTGSRYPLDEIAYVGQAWVVDGLNGFEKWLGYFAETASDGRTQRIDRMHFFDRALFVDGPTDRWTPGHHPGPAKPQLLNTFPLSNGPMLGEDWAEQTSGSWSVANEEAVQSDQTAWALNTVNRDAAANYLIEANLKFTQTQDSEDKAGVLAYYEDGNNWMIVGLDRSTGYGADNWYCHLKENGVDTVYSGGYNGSVDYSVYHKIRVTKNGGKFDIRIDDMIPPGHSTISTAFTGAGTPGIYTDQTAASFDGIIYTIGWDEFDAGITGWGDNINGIPMVGGWSLGANGITMASGTGYTFKGDLMPEYEVSAQVYKEGSANGRMGLFAAAVDGNNYAYALIDTASNQLQVGGRKGGVDLAAQTAGVANKDDYNIRVVKLANKLIVFVDGVEKITLNETYGPAQVGLYTLDNMSARFNGIMAYRMEPEGMAAPWVKSDIGAVGFPGTVDYFDDALYMTGSGADIWNLNDEFTFTHMNTNGDWEVSARVVNLDETDYWSKAVLMFRNDLAVNSGMVMMNTTGGDLGLGHVQMIWRNGSGSGTGVHDVSGLNYPIWLKLKRQGATFSGYYSSDGQNWTLLGSETPPLNSTGKLGFGVTSHNNDRIATAVFDNILIAEPAPNNPPSFTADPIVEVNGLEDSAYSSSLVNDATDADSDPLSFSRISGPTWLNVAANGGLSGTPSSAYIGLNSFNVQVDDGNGGSDSTTLQITVDALPNTAPQFTTDPVAEINATEGSAYSSSLADNATDADADPLTFSKVSGPAWLSVASNGVLSGTPANGDVGLNSFNVQVDDGNGGTDTASLQITVDGALPSVASNPTPADGATNVSADQDLIWTSGTYSTEHLLNGGTINPPPFLGSYSTSTIDVGTLAYSTTYYWSIDEINSYGTNAGPVWSFTTEANTPPTFSAHPVVEDNATENAAYSSSIADDASDANSDPLTFSKVSGPAWLGIASNGALSGTPVASDVGLNSFSVQVDDGNGGTDTATLEITVDGALPGIASNPIPADGATNVSVDQDLNWTAGAFATTHGLNGGTVNPPPFLWNNSNAPIDVGTLAYSTTYYWSIDEINSYGTNAGPVWTFTTEAAP